MDEARYAIMLLKHRYDGPRRHGKHCFCHECLQDEMNAKDDRIEALEKELDATRRVFRAYCAKIGADYSAIESAISSVPKA